MGPVIAALILGGMASGQLSATDAKLERHSDTPVAAEASGNAAATTLSALPAVPRGKSTAIGGVIHTVDPVRDQLTLNIYGAKPMKILFDERTQVFRDGTKVSLRDIRPNDRAAVETVLDGTKVFALSVHMLSKAPMGECQGQVVSYNPSTSELTVNDALSSQPIKLRVPAGTAIIPARQTGSSNGNVGSSSMVKGTLISVKFEADHKGQGVARQIAILATPGSPFDFNGTVTFIDVHSGTLAIAPSNYDGSYKISFDAARFPLTRELREGAHVRVTAVFDGTHYIASEIANE